MPTKHITDNEFSQEVLNSNLPVLVDFWAPWCGPCKIVGPVLEELSDELEGKIKIVKLNVDENPKIAQEHHVMSIPTMKIFKAGHVVDEMVGAAPKQKIAEKLNEYI